MTDSTESSIKKPEETQSIAVHETNQEEKIEVTSVKDHEFKVKLFTEFTFLKIVGISK